VSGAVVIDASLALKWVLAEAYTAEAVQLVEEWEHQDITPIAPSWFAAEIANVLFQRMRQGTLMLADVQLAVPALLAEVEMRDTEPETAVRAVEIAQQIGERATYDSQYAALAEHEGCELWTADDRFHAAVVSAFPFVHHVREVTV
jgi:predicted nucleic acid-binding protein